MYFLARAVADGQPVFMNYTEDHDVCYLYREDSKHGGVVEIHDDETLKAWNHQGEPVEPTTTDPVKTYLDGPWTARNTLYLYSSCQEIIHQNSCTLSGTETCLNITIAIHKFKSFITHSRFQPLFHKSPKSSSSS